jgi:putative transposase
MNRAKCNELDYIHFLIAAQKTFTCTEAARCQPEHPNAPAHDAFTRLLQRQPLDTEALWQEVQPCVQRQQGLLVIDDTTLDKPYAQKMDYVTYHWSGKHQRVVKGIALMTLLWTDGQALLPCDFRVYDKPFGGASKNSHFRAMLQQAWVRGFAPAYVVMDSWYASLENLKWIASVGWHFVTRLRSNRLVNPDGLGNRPISTVDIPLEGCVVHLKGFGWVKVFRTVSPHGDAEYLATNDLEMTQAVCLQVLRWSWGIEVYHRALKQCCGVERAQVRGRRAVWGHLLLALRAFVRLEVSRLRSGVSWYGLKLAIIRGAIREYLARPRYDLQPTA